MAFTKILCPTDFSQGSEQAIRYAVRLAMEHDAELVIAHAWYVPASMYDGEYLFPASVVGTMSDDARRALDDAVRAASASGAKRVSAKFLTGLPWRNLVDLLQQEPFDLCVMGTHGRSGVARVLLGSVAEKVMRHAPCSTLLVRPGGETKPFTHVLCASDFSPSSVYALELATTIAKPDAAITLMHVIEVPVAVGSDVPFADFARDLDKRCDDALRAQASRFPRPITTTSRIGSPGAQILEAIDADPAIDLVVTGSHGHTGLKRLLLGSVAEKIGRHARCPVLVARQRA